MVWWSGDRTVFGAVIRWLLSLLLGRVDGVVVACFVEVECCLLCDTGWAFYWVGGWCFVRKRLLFV